MIPKYLLIYSLFFFLFSCNNNIEKLAEDKSAEKLFFGRYGGVTNNSMDYLIVNKTFLIKKEQDTFTLIRKLSSIEQKKIDILVHEVNGITLVEYGNITYYIRLQTNSFEKVIKWSDQSDNKLAKDIYTSLIALVRN